MRRHNRQIPRRRVMFGIGQTVRVDKVRVRRAEFVRPPRHVFSEICNRAVDVFGNGNRAVVARNQHHAVKQFAERNFFVHVEPQRRTFGIVRARSDGDNVVERLAFERGYQRHHFRRACGEHSGIGVAFVQDMPRRSLHDNRGSRRDVRQNVVRVNGSRVLNRRDGVARIESRIFAGQSLQRLGNFALRCSVQVHQLRGGHSVFGSRLSAAKNQRGQRHHCQNFFHKSSSIRTEINRRGQRQFRGNVNRRGQRRTSRATSIVAATSNFAVNVKLRGNVNRQYARKFSSPSKFFKAARTLGVSETL